LFFRGLNRKPTPVVNEGKREKKEKEIKDLGHKKGKGDESNLIHALQNGFISHTLKKKKEISRRDER